MEPECKTLSEPCPERCRRSGKNNKCASKPGQAVGHAKGMYSKAAKAAKGSKAAAHAPAGQFWSEAQPVAARAASVQRAPSIRHVEKAWEAPADSFLGAKEVARRGVGRRVLGKQPKLPFAMGESLCTSMTEAECGSKPGKMAHCHWTKEGKDGSKAHCGRDKVMKGGADPEMYTDAELDQELENEDAYVKVNYDGEELFLDKKRVGSEVYEMVGTEFDTVGKVTSLNPLEIKFRKH